jgi:hypothetical protein
VFRSMVHSHLGIPEQSPYFAVTIFVRVSQDAATTA